MNADGPRSHTNRNISSHKNPNWCHDTYRIPWGTKKMSSYRARGFRKSYSNNIFLLVIGRPPSMLETWDSFINNTRGIFNQSSQFQDLFFNAQCIPGAGSLASLLMFRCQLDLARTALKLYIVIWKKIGWVSSWLSVRTFQAINQNLQMECHGYK
jgi:hypothetical protein